jgi:hypothetical protein
MRPQWWAARRRSYAQVIERSYAQVIEVERVVTDIDCKVGRTGDSPDTVSAAPARTGKRAAGPVDGDLPRREGQAS